MSEPEQTTPLKRRRAKRSRAKKLGLPPGTAIYTGEKKVEHVRLTAMVYNQTSFVEEVLNTPEDCLRLITEAEKSQSIAWINVDGLHEVSIIERIGVPLGLHPLVIEDIVSTSQRPKSLDYEKYLHTVIRMLNLNQSPRRVESEQLSLILGPHYVLSFQEQEGDCFDQLRDRIRAGKGRSRGSGADYLYYALIDSVVDYYFVVVEDVDARIEALEEELLTESEPHHLARIHKSRRELIDIRRAVWPLREVLQDLVRDDGHLINPSTRLFIRDAYDHTIEVIEVVELLRDTASGLIELYMSHASNKVNMVMKTLTVVSTIFMPLTFIVGVYGMNFDFMPELHWPLGYPLVWTVMILIALLMVIQFRKREWI